MSNSYFTPKDVIASRAKCVNEPWLKLDLAKVRKGKLKQNTTFYIPLLARNLTGKYIQLNLQFKRQVVASAAKPPASITEEEAKDVRIIYRELSREDLEASSYREDKLDGLLASNKEFITALDIIASEYQKIAEEEVLTHTDNKFKLQKIRTINNFRQTHRNVAENEEGGNSEGKVALPVPMYRLKIPADPTSKKIGNPANEKNDHQYIVFDISKSTTVNSVYHPVVAKLKTSTGFTDLTINNIKHFITYMSLTGGKVSFDSICVSKQGISLMCKIRDIHVLRHKQLKTESLDAEGAGDMNEYGADINEDDEVFDAPNETGEDAPAKPAAKTSTKPKNTLGKALSRALDNDEDEVTVEDEPEENEEEETPKITKGSKAKEEPEEAEEEPEEAEDEQEAGEEPDEETTKKTKPPPKPAAKPAAKPKQTGGNLKAGPRRK